MQPVKLLSIKNKSDLYLWVTNKSHRDGLPLHDIYKLEKLNVKDNVTYMSELSVARLDKLSRKVPFIKSIPRLVTEQHFYEPSFHHIDRSTILWGYWISHKYLEGYESAIKSIFNLRISERRPGISI